MIDFAGCGAVHMVGGVSGIVGAYIVGPRIGRYNPDGTSNPQPGHNVPLLALGTLMLWFGWCALARPPLRSLARLCARSPDRSPARL